MAAGGYNVNIRDPSFNQRTSALYYIKSNVKEYSKITGIKRSLGQVQASESIEDAIKDAWSVIEAVPEKLQLKIDTFAQLEQLALNDCLLTSNSSSFKTSQMLEKVKPETRKRIFNTHYLMPLQVRTVELMTSGEMSSDIFPFYVDRLRDIGFCCCQEGVYRLYIQSIMGSYQA